MTAVRSRLRPGVVAAVWLVSSAIWAVVIIVTDQLAWPLALWIAMTVGPITALERRTNASSRRAGTP